MAIVHTHKKQIVHTYTQHTLGYSHCQRYDLAKNIAQHFAVAQTCILCNLHIEQSLSIKVANCICCIYHYGTHVEFVCRNLPKICM